MLNFLLCTLAVYRLAHLITREDGPFDIFTKLRTVVHGFAGEDSWFWRGINCPLCVSFWIALPAGFALGETAVLQVVWWLAVAGANCLLFTRVL